ncbi:uncharacterized protein LOC124456100 isoform X2 [Xenia sp. Carnegie-2017]|uniref:uncharacterized protein LOC124456100 isoform X2 n=1 Tax=Xenia sp. Carnegie-2017 TaxID=2897299 RepID=UPI001F045C80|nr:uncharacterized protein LOC124456100 isoform X2 [Xenia sp. Carnegie-2017]
MKWIRHWHFLGFPLELHQRCETILNWLHLAKKKFLYLKQPMKMMQAISLIFLKKNGHKILAPSESGICSCGAEWDKRSIQDEWLYVDLCSVAYFYSIHDVKVYCRPCSSCATKKHYDGIENRIVWFGSYAIFHAVLKDYNRLFITSSSTNMKYEYYVAYVQRQVSSGNFNFPKEIIYAKFRLAIIAMIRLLDIDFDNVFFCELRGRIPQKVVMDGTTLGIQKTFLPNNLRESDTGLLDGSRFEMRNFINRRNVRALLKKYSDSKLSWDEFQELKSEISSKGLRTLLEWLEKQGFITSCPNSCRRLLAALASDKPVCAIVPPKEVLDLLIRMSDGANPKDNPSTDLKLLHEEVPLMLNVIETSEEIPITIQPLLKELVQKAISPFVVKDGQWRLPHNLPAVSQNSSHGYIPCLPELVQRGNYVLDNRKTQQGDCAKVTRPKKKHGTLIPGIFCILCPHGIYVMNSANENLFYYCTPELVIYDNACRLHEYCLNRDPAFFKKTKFVVKFHWKNHSVASFVSLRLKYSLRIFQKFITFCNTCYKQ